MKQSLADLPERLEKRQLPVYYVRTVLLNLDFELTLIAATDIWAL